MQEFRLGVSSVIFPHTPLTEEDCALLKELGFAALEVATRHSKLALDDGRRREELISVIKKARVPVYSLHAPYRPDRDISLLDDHRRETAVAHAVQALALARDVGARIMVVHGSDEPIAATERAARRSQARRSLAALVTAARQCKVRLALEMMPPEWIPAGTAEALDMVDGLDAEVIGFCLDTNHANLTGNLADIIHALGRRIWSTHISDNDGTQQRHWLPFTGVIDWKSFMEAFVLTGGQIPLTYELDAPAEGTRRGLTDISNTFARLLALAPGGGHADASGNSAM